MAENYLHLLRSFLQIIANNWRRITSPLTSPTNAIYDVLKSAILNRGNLAATEKSLENELRAHGINVQASTIIKVMADKGIIAFTGSNLYAPNAITFGSREGEAWIGDRSSMTTDKTQIDAGDGAHIQTKGNAEVRQNPDGSISFLTGEDGSISFFTKK